MPLITDRDLLIREPSLFVAAETSATLLRNATDGVVSGTTITSASSNFIALGIDFGHVASIQDVPCEVIARPAQTQLTVSLPRASTNDPLIEPASGSAQKLRIPTFKRLIDLSEAWVLGALGIDPDHPSNPLETTAIVNLDAVKNLIAARTIYQAFALAAAALPTTTSLQARADLYATLFDMAKRSTEVFLDLDGDGDADTVRRLDAIMFVR